MKNTILTLCAILSMACVAPQPSQAASQPDGELKETLKEVGKSTKEAAKEFGKETKKVSKKVAKKSKKAAKKVKKGSKKAAKQIKSDFNDVKDAIKD